MDLKILGCHGGETPKHRTSSFLIDDKLAIDAGAITSMMSLEDQRRIEAVLVSHAHMDHVRDLATLADNRCQQDGPPLHIVGTPETLDSLRKHFFNNRLWPDFSRIRTKSGPTIRFKAIAPDKTAIVAGLEVRPVLVSHTIETSGFIIRGKRGSIVYSGDTGPTRKLWQAVNEVKDLRALLMEVSFPNEQSRLARLSGHHTPESLGKELNKLKDHHDLPILLYHIKPVFQPKVEKQLAKIRGRNLTVLRLGDHFRL